MDNVREYVESLSDGVVKMDKNTQKKYEFTGETMEVRSNGRSIVLRRIRALCDLPAFYVRKGDLGGWIEGEWNLSQYLATCSLSGVVHYYGAWVGVNAKVFEDARVEDEAYVLDNACVFGRARVGGDGRVYGSAWVFGQAVVMGNANVTDASKVYGDAVVTGNALVSDDMRVWCGTLGGGGQQQSNAQPAPVKNSYPEVWPLVVKDMGDRNEFGRAKYGVGLQPHNGRDVLRDAYEEALDLCVYLRQAIFERDGK